MKRTKYYILDVNNPELLWRVNPDSTVDLTIDEVNNWKSSVQTKNLLMADTDVRNINKAEAKSLFPLAFPPHTKEGK